MIVTVNLAKEAFRLSKQKTIVKNINSIQSFGAMDVLCTDKTGTLTEDRIILEKHINVDGKEDNRVLIYGFLNSQFQTGLKNLLDRAIIQKALDTHMDDSASQFTKIDEIPFDFQRRRMSVVLKDTTGKTQLITKGALEEILEISDYAEYQGKTVKITLQLKEHIFKLCASLNEQGMRVIAISTNTLPLPTDRPFEVKDEDQMKLIGFVALLDPPKLSSKQAILDLQKKGVSIKVLTGDNDVVAKYICSQVGLRGRKLLLGAEIEAMSQEALEQKVMNVTIFAKLTPEQKSRVVLAIKANKHVVGFMGDGINDAAAMRVADMGISVDTAVDIAKESADIILLEKDLTILGQGCVEGRKTYANIIKYIKMTVSSNFGNMLSMLVASIWLASCGILPMRPEQILILNLIYDFAQLALP
jgi:Mg2+-importing ATPase